MVKWRVDSFQIDLGYEARLKLGNAEWEAARLKQLVTDLPHQDGK